ncbi:MAG: 50S ribosomal protein L32 [Parcubacteria group bacterium CG10_big_fil_rev_8_21_14_0_10_36_14]|nr:MAG: 50S ribosomal protein L32 [Parcubacteria group bacterium CG10_big_fil_rev_8_21_14_0_10_36_14]
MMKPKVKTNKAKQGHRRSHDALTPATLTKCKKCGATKRPHFACPKCN